MSSAVTPSAVTTPTVLIAGAGPVGLTLALELTRYGVPVRLVDRMSARETTSRAVALWPRTLELMERAGGGLAAELVGRGNKVTVANMLDGERVIARVALEGIATAYPFVLMLPQVETESVLVAHLAGRGITAELGVELAGFTQDGEGVSARLRHADGTEESGRYGFLVACDGAHSPVRHALGLTFEGETLGNDWGQGDFHLSGVPFPPNEMATYFHADGPLVLFPMAPGRYRVIMGLGLSRGETPPVPTLAEFQALLDTRGPGGITLQDSLWTSAFRINERQVNAYRAGRVFLAGDAAHVHSPAGGQGMNTGMQDAMNLAWKLALAARRIATAPVLLESYDPERRAVGAEVIAASGRLTRIATLQEPLARRLRDAVMHVALGLPPVRHAIEGQLTEITTGYRDSPLNGVSWEAGPRAGERMAPIAGEPPYGAGDTPRFTLRVGADAGPPPPGILGPLVDPELRANPLAGGIELVRPDGYLAMAVSEGEWSQVADYLHRLAVPG
ncbi:FAD-dependent monooxygenase [Ancylobacter terrae]|uniref:FAD-dependent monooxygenase n=1 Tax=Ancylobacter sp. sgz301288 TaxID=3342077 RepID=UPI003858290A